MKDLEQIPLDQSVADGAVDQDLAAALRLQRLLADISSRFVTRTEVELDDTIEETQRLICETLGLDRSTLWQTTGDHRNLTLTHFWQRVGCVQLRRNYVTAGNLPWAESVITQGKHFHFSSLLELPPEASQDRQTLRSHGTQSYATFPLVADGKVFGALAFDAVTEERQWTEDEISGLQLVTQIFGHVISRQRAHGRVEQLREEIARSSRASMLGELAAAFAHEINQPLTTILSNAQAARRFLDQENADPTEIRSILDDIIRDDKRAGEVVRNLREMLAGNPARKEPNCLNEIVRETAKFLVSDLESEGVELKLHLATSMPQMNLARIEIQQTILNVVCNAIHALRETPLSRRRIDLDTSVDESRVYLCVRDRGCGILQDHIDRIFEPFHTTRSDGIGMGLAICRRIVEAHGGNIHAANRKSGGARFSFSLPFRNRS